MPILVVKMPVQFFLTGNKQDDKIIHNKSFNEKEVYILYNPIVRYGWAANPVVNLYNNEGLPDVPFRTDDYKMTTER